MRSDHLPPATGQVVSVHAAGLDAAGTLAAGPVGARLVLVEREQLAENAARGLPPMAVEGETVAWVETEGVCLRAWNGRLVIVGEALVKIDGVRESAGLPGQPGSTARLGVWAEVVRPGPARAGDRVASLPSGVGTDSVVG